MGSWEGTAFMALVFRECLKLVGRLEQRRLLGGSVVREADLKDLYESGLPENTTGTNAGAAALCSGNWEQAGCQREGHG